MVFGGQNLPAAVSAIPAALTVVTSMFLHGGLFRLIGNMLYLWIFGNNVEDAMGHGRFLFFFLITGVAASMTHVLMDVHSTIPAIGASGAISGVLGAYILLYSRAEVMVLFFLGIFIRLIYIPAGIMLGLYLILQILQRAITWGQEGGGVAWFAHIGGFIAGLLLVGLFKKQAVALFQPARYHARRLERWQSRY